MIWYLSCGMINCIVHLLHKSHCRCAYCHCGSIVMVHANVAACGRGYEDIHLFIVRYHRTSTTRRRGREGDQCRFEDEQEHPAGRS
jgi:hypothetical protein